MTDAELALQMYTEDLQTCDAVLTDRKLAQSIATAVLRDGHLIRQAYEQEHQLARDREMALRLKGDDGHVSHAAFAPTDPLPKKRKTEHDASIWTDDEMLAKVAAIYKQEPGSAETLTQSPKPDYNKGKAAVAESSAWAASRKHNEKPMMGHCVICNDDFDFFEVARVPCNHEYCRACLEQLFRLSMTDESLFPPRCDDQEIPLSRVRFFLPSGLAKEFEQRYAELNTKNRTYCHDKHCSSFVPSAAIDDNVATCPRCRKTTCTMCKAPSHSGDCPEDDALQQLIATAEVQQWQRCHSCKRIVELELGCNHIT